MCSCTLVSMVCPRCAVSSGNAKQFCPSARGVERLCDNCHLAEIPGEVCAGCCKERSGAGRRLGHAARASVSSLLQSGNRRGACDELVTVRYEHTRATEPFMRGAAPAAGADKADRLTQWPSVLEAASTTAPPSPQKPPVPALSPKRALLSRPQQDGDGLASDARTVEGCGVGRESPLPPVLPGLELPPRCASRWGSSSGLSDSSSVYSQ